MKSLLAGIALIVLLGLGGFLYRNAVEYADEPLSCPVDTLTCPDGTELSHPTTSCAFPVCPPPNVTLSDINISFALPEGFAPFSIGDVDPTISAVYSDSTSTPAGNSIFVRHFDIAASSTALATIQQTAIGGASGEPVNPTQFSSKTLGGRLYTVVSIERFEGVIDTAYYLARSADVLRFDAIDLGTDWTNPALDIYRLPAHQALEKMLTTLQRQQ